jgi:CheY-like chemotaxis protein
MDTIGYQTKPVTPQNLDNVFDTINSLLAGSNKKLLIVENDDALRNSIAQLLDLDDVNITTASAGQEAYHLLQSERFDLMVLDLGLADISGFELLEKIQENPALARLAVIVYTGRELTKEEETILKKSAKTIIIKGSKANERLLDEVTLFLHHIDAHLPEDQRHKPRIRHDKEELLQDKIVLVVDDDMRNVFALSNVLEEKGMTVVIAENGKEALKRLDSQKDIDIVLMDIMMSEMDGYETMRRIRQQPEFRKLPIIALTAKAMKGDRQKCLDAGANDYLPKPLNIDKLLSLLRIWLY